MDARSNVQQLSVGLSARSMQAWFAAQSGVEWAVRQATVNQATHDALCGNPKVVTNFSISAGAFSGCNLAITYSDGGGFTEAGIAYEVDLITVLATSGAVAGTTCVSRTLQSVITTGTNLP